MQDAKASGVRRDAVRGGGRWRNAGTGRVPRQREITLERGFMVTLAHGVAVLG